jgi:hypothetical protein
MEIVQTGTGTWRWCMGMFGARFAVFVRPARVFLNTFYRTQLGDSSKNENYDH